ncbi:UNVERIFIED_CONTAM: hypothetical protein Scaly_2752600 [Sesamum calycinum]|uniref:Uncharacterized protein n=1 Tax=Sesamum calycinum TaxID=2727403 RepID=A0AAW2J0C0_9LAMI
METEDAETAPRNDNLWLLKSIFSKKTKVEGDAGADSKHSGNENLPIPFLSPHANSVVSHCSKKLLLAAIRTLRVRMVGHCFIPIRQKWLFRIIKFVQNAMGPQVIANLSLAEDEIVIDVDGTVPTQPVLQHTGMSAWPGMDSIFSPSGAESADSVGRLTLTNYALYFESGVGLYDKAVRYDLAIEMKQVIKPELTGPLGARLFDKAVMYKSTSMLWRDYWLDICLEILRAHKFTRKYNMKGTQQSEALARAIIGIFRFRAVREAFSVSSSNYKTLLCFNLAESLPGGDMIMETLSNRLKLISSSAGQRDVVSSPKGNRPAAYMTLIALKIVSSKEAALNGEATYQGGDVCVGESDPLEALLKQLKLDTGMAEAAQATVDQVKVEGIDTNIAVMKELIFPLIETYNRLQRLASWNDPYKSVMFVLFFSYMIIRDWIKYILPSIFVFLALVMLWRRYAWKRRQLEAFKIVPPPAKNPVEQLLTLQEAVTQVFLIYSPHYVLLDSETIFSRMATGKVALSLVLMALVITFLPLKYLLLLGFVEFFTRNMAVRKESSEKGMRRVREWWTRIPAAPVEVMKIEDKKKK